MFKLCIFVSVCAALVIWHFDSLGNPRLENLGEGTFKIFSTERISSPLATRQDLGFAFVYRTCSSKAQKLRDKFSVIDGEAITLDNFKSPNRILKELGYQYITSQSMGGLFVVYGYSGRGRNYITNGNTRINLQIAIRDGIVTVGWPVILSSF